MSVSEVKTLVMSFMLTVWLSLPFILKLACKSGSSVSLSYEKHLGSCKIVEKEKCGVHLLVALKQTS